MGDGFVARVLDYVGAEGEMSEQIDRGDGRQRGASHLTWSYASFLRAHAARERAAKVAAHS